MRVTCPACAAAYEVPDTRIGAGRKLRCARCGHDWWVDPARPPGEGPFARAVVQAASPPGRAAPEPVLAAAAPPPPPLPPVAPPPAPVPAALARKAPRAAPDRAKPPLPGMPGPVAPPPQEDRAAEKTGPLAMAWLATALIVLGCVAAVFLYRVEIIEAWPPAERFYIALGMGPAR